jgi:DNA topoisomerase-1
LEKRILEKTFGKEKNKLVIQPTGILCIEFLIKHFNQLFSYDYTKNMENELDKITTQESSITLCTQCDESIQELIKPVAKIEKQQYKIDANHFLVFNQYGASIKEIAPGKDTVYLPVKKTLKLDLDKLKRGEYTLDDLLEFEHANLGKYKDQDLFLRIGKYGNYVEWGDSRINIDTIGIPLNNITIEDISQFLDKSQKTDGLLVENNQVEKDSVNILEESNQENNLDKEFSRINHPSNKMILRTLDSNFSIRKGKFGNYVYYKTFKMKTPEFYNIKDFSKTGKAGVDQPVNALTCDAKIVIEWLKTTYKLI